MSRRKGKVVMKAYVEEHGDFVRVYCGRGYMEVQPSGRCSIYVWNDGGLAWGSAGRYAWDRGVIEDCPGCIPEVVYEAFESALWRWSGTAEGRAWLKAHQVSE